MKLAVSACLLGYACRFDGRTKPCATVIELGSHHRLVPICPEMAGGLPIPHPPCEIASRNPLRVIDSTGADRTDAFVRGAQITLQKVLEESCDAAILKANSPSCGIERVYDGTFSGTLVAGDGVAARMLKDAGIPSFDERSFSGNGKFLF